MLIQEGNGSINSIFVLLKSAEGSYLIKVKNKSNLVSVIYLSPLSQSVYRNKCEKYIVKSSQVNARRRSARQVVATSKGGCSMYP